MTLDTKLWEILVPRRTNDGAEIPLEHHHQWDEKVRSLSNGLTVLRTAKGQWVSPEGTLFRDEMIPVRVWCSEPTIRDIMTYTKQHYNQEAVMAYAVSTKVLMLTKDDVFQE